MINHDTANKHLDDLTVLLKDPEKKSTDVLDLVCNFSADTTPDKAIKEDDDQTISSSEDRLLSDSKPVKHNSTSDTKRKALKRMVRSFMYNFIEKYGCIQYRIIYLSV